VNIARILTIFVAVALLTLLHPHVRSAAPPKQQRATLMKGASAIRLISGALIVLVLLWVAAELAEAWPQPVRWMVWFAALAAALIASGNVLAGLWVLSPFAGVDPGAVVVAAGHRGRVVGYGTGRLELVTRNGWSVRLPYLRLVYQPLLVRRSDRPRRVELAFHRPHWSEEELAHLLQAALLSPYRDLTSPASVVRQADVVTVHLGLCHRGAEPHVRHLLEQVISEFGTPAARSHGKAPREG
jgi:hypothetical protein